MFAVETQRIAVLRADAGRRGGGGHVLLRDGLHDGAAVAVQQSAKQSFWGHEQNELERKYHHVDDEEQPPDCGDRGKSAGNELLLLLSLLITINATQHRQYRMDI